METILNAKFDWQKATFMDVPLANGIKVHINKPGKDGDILAFLASALPSVKIPPSKFMTDGDRQQSQIMDLAWAGHREKEGSARIRRFELSDADNKTIGIAFVEQLEQPVQNSFHRLLFIGILPQLQSAELENAFFQAILTTVDSHYLVATPSALAISSQPKDNVIEGVFEDPKLHASAYLN